MNIIKFLKIVFGFNRCIHCNTIILDYDNNYFCNDCLIEYKKEVLTSYKRCSNCGEILISEDNLCYECRLSDNKFFDNLYFFLYYKNIGKKLISSYKFNNNILLKDFFVELLLDYLSKNEIIVPVAPNYHNVKKRGFDPVNEIIKILEKKGYLVSRCIKRYTTKKSQKELNRENRLTNVSSLFYFDKKFCIKDKNIILLDDVYTTGATVQVCSKILKENGATSVKVVTLVKD